nr:hypothetical protein [Tanacetum cinerariifolium]
LDVTGLCCDELKASLESAGQDHKFGGLYDLVAILTHEGMTIYSGHYIAWVKDHASTWVEMDDSSATAKKEADLAAMSGGDGGQIAYLCINKARHNDYPSEAKDEDFICIFKRPKKPRFYVADSDDIFPKVVQKVKNAILQDEDFIRQCSWVFILGVMAFLGLLFAVIPEGFIGRHMSVFLIDILALWIEFASGIALALIYYTSVSPRLKAQLWVINMLSMVCGFLTYSWSIEVRRRSTRKEATKVPDLNLIGKTPLLTDCLGPTEAVFFYRHY